MEDYKLRFGNQVRHKHLDLSTSTLFFVFFRRKLQRGVHVHLSVVKIYFVYNFVNFQ